MTIHPWAFANTLAIATAVLALFLLVLRVLVPPLFVFVFNAQFFGADVAALLPKEPSGWKTTGELLAFVGGAWGFGFVGAIVYNRLIRTRAH